MSGPFVLLSVRQAGSADEPKPSPDVEQGVANLFRRSIGSAIVALPAAGGLIGCAGDPPPELGVVVGLGAIDSDQEGALPPVIDGPQVSGRFAINFDGNVANVDDRGSGPRLGFRFGFSGAREDLDERRVAGEPFLTIEDYAAIGLFTPQGTLGYRQYFSGDAYYGGVFLEPGVGVGPVIGTLTFGSDLEFGNDTIANDIDDTETQIGLGVQPHVRLAYDGGTGIVGLEGGYLFTTLDFDDNLGDNFTEWYIGLFAALRLGR
jgi:hypothetical protein